MQSVIENANHAICYINYYTILCIAYVGPITPVP